jgi:hypothetical protein
LNNDQALKDMILSNEDLKNAMKNSTTNSNTDYGLDQRFVDNILFLNLPYNS